LVARSKESIAIEKSMASVFRILQDHYVSNPSGAIAVADISRRAKCDVDEVVTALRFFERGGLSLGFVGTGINRDAQIAPTEHFLTPSSYAAFRRQVLERESRSRERVNTFPLVTNPAWAAHHPPHRGEGEWEKARARVTADPEGAITLARTQLERTVKVVLEEMGIAFAHEKLPKLYMLAATNLDLAPDRKSADAVRQLLGGCLSIVSGLAALRNQLGDAHGHGNLSKRPGVRHADLAVRVSGALARFLVASHDAKSGP
jgi:hypothetical protein